MHCTDVFGFSVVYYLMRAVTENTKTECVSERNLQIGLIDLLVLLFFSSQLVFKMGKKIKDPVLILFTTLCMLYIVNMCV